MTDPLRSLPASFGERVAGLMDGSLQPAPTRDASTVVLLRDGATGVEVYLLRRVRSMAFAAGMYVFPGGSVDPADQREDIPWTGPPAQAWTAPLGADVALTEALVAAAVRETFEESGVLLAGGTGADIADPVWEERRRALEAHELSLSTLLADQQLALRADLLRPWAHWITPEVEPKRYDTRFFVAALPADQVTRDVGGEADRTLWIRPAEALERHRAGALECLPPTLVTLSEIDEVASGGVAGVLAAADARDIRTRMPRVVLRDGQVALLLPDDVGYTEAYPSR